MPKVIQQKEYPKALDDYGEKGEFLPTEKYELYKVEVRGEKSVIEHETRILFDEFLEFAAGWRSIDYGEKKLNPPLHTSGRYATSLSFSIRTKKPGVYTVAFRSTGEAPEAFAIEFGRKKLDLKKYMLNGAKSMVIPLKNAGMGVATLPDLSGQSRYKSFSKHNRNVSTQLHRNFIENENPDGPIFRLMNSSDKKKWIMRKWPHRRKEDYKMIPFAPAHVLLDELVKRMKKINAEQ